MGKRKFEAVSNRFPRTGEVGLESGAIPRYGPRSFGGNCPSVRCALADNTPTVSRSGLQIRTGCKAAKWGFCSAHQFAGFIETSNSCFFRSNSAIGLSFHLSAWGEVGIGDG